MTAPGFTATFGGSAIFPSNPSYRAVALSANTTLAWPTEIATDDGVVAAIMDVTPTTGGLTLTMPPANQTTPGNGALIVNRGASTFTVADNAGNTITTVAAGIGWSVWITDNSTVAGTWKSAQYGAGVSSANAGALAGYGIKAISSSLNQSISVTQINTNYIAGAPDRAGLLNWAGGAGTVTLPAAVGVGNDWYVQLRNSGTGAVTLLPPGAETIDGGASLTFNPGDSAFITCDGTNFLSLGFGQAPAFTFSYISISLTAHASPYTLSGAELNQIAYNLGGVLTTNMSIVVPNTVQQYWIRNTTTGAYTLTVKTAAGTGVAVTQGGAAILYCDGTNVVAADTATVASPIAVAGGGTGATTAGNALVNLGGTAIGVALFTVTSEALGRLALLAAASGANSDITSLTGLTTPLGAAYGGTGLASYAVGDITYASGATTLAKLADVATGNVLLSGGVTTAPAYGKVGLTTHISGTLAVGNGGSGATTLTGMLIGNGAGAFTTVTAPAGTVVGTTDTQTLTNKRIDPRVVSAASASSLTPDASAADEYAYTALAAGLTINAPIGTPVDGDKLLFRLLDNGTSRSLTWNAIYRVVGVILPTATTLGKLTYVGAVYNAAATKWDVVAVATEA